MTELPMPPASSYELAWGGRRGGVTLERRIQRDGTALWAIYEDSNTCLIGPGLWAQERQPSSRTEDYLSKARHGWEGALDLWRRHVVVALSGATWRGNVAHDLPVTGCERLYDPWRLVELVGVQEGRPKPGSWIGEATVGAGREADGPQDSADVALYMDQDFRRAVGLFGDACFREGTVSAVVGDDGGFSPDLTPHLRDSLCGDLSKVSRPLMADLAALLSDGTRFPIGLATLRLRSGAVIAEILDRRPGIDV